MPVYSNSTLGLSVYVHLYFSCCKQGFLTLTSYLVLPGNILKLLVLKLHLQAFYII